MSVRLESVRDRAVEVRVNHKPHKLRDFAVHICVNVSLRVVAVRDNKPSLRLSPHIFRNFRVALDRGEGRVFVGLAVLDIVHLFTTFAIKKRPERRFDA